MKLGDGPIRLDWSQITLADIEDFEALTGTDLQSWLEQADEELEAFREGGLAVLANPEIQAMLWILLRDDDARERVYDKAEDLKRAFRSDMRALAPVDLLKVEFVDPKAELAQPKAKRQTASQKRAGKREAKAG